MEMIDNLADCGFKRILVIGSVVKYRRGLAVALLRLLDKPQFSAIDPFEQGLPEHDYDWSEVDLVIVDMSENKPAIRSWYFDLITQVSLPMAIFLDRSATVDDAGDMVRAGGADYIDITKVSAQRLTRALLMAANLREERFPQPVKAQQDENVSEAQPISVEPVEAAKENIVEPASEPEPTTDLLPEVRPITESTKTAEPIRFDALPEDDGMTDEPTEVLPRLDPTTLEPVVTNELEDHSLNNQAYGVSELPDDRVYRAESLEATDINDSLAANDDDEYEIDEPSEASFITPGLIDIVERNTDEHDVPNKLREGKSQPYVETGYTGEMDAYEPEIELNDRPSEASFITTGLMSILERDNVAEQAELPEHHGKAVEFSMGQRWPFTPADIEAGKASLNNYDVIEFVAVGGTASVFKVKHQDTQQLSAMKLFDMDTSDQQGQKRFLRGYQLIEEVNHEHVVKIRDLAQYQNSAYSIMEYFPGGDLKDRIKEGIDRQDVVRFTAQIASALHAAHQKNILHRDLKPSNIMFRDNGELAILDFGIAKLMAEGQTTLTFSGQVVGTPHYVSPEQAVGSQLDGRSDLYALGVILYEMLERVRPYRGESSLEIMRLHVNGEVPQLSSPQDPLNDVVTCLLAKEREDRYATGQDLIQALSQAIPDTIEKKLLKAS